MAEKLSKWVENTVVKGEIARYEQFLLFPQCFQKACFLGASKGVIVWEWSKTNPFQKKLFFLRVYKSFENSEAKGEFAHYKQFLLFPVFLHFWRIFNHFHQIQNCCLQSLSIRSLNFVVWERLNSFKVKYRYYFFFLKAEHKINETQKGFF